MQKSFFFFCFFFYNQNLNLLGKLLQKLASCNKCMTYHSHTNEFLISHVQFLSLTAYKMKEISLFICMEACFRYVLIYGASVFLSHSGTVANDQTI